MKEIKAYIHRNRVADVISALKGTPAWNGSTGNQPNLALSVVQALLLPLDSAERHYSLDLGEEVVNAYKLELQCEDAQVDEFVNAIVAAGRTGQDRAGWVYVVDLVRAEAIG